MDQELRIELLNVANEPASSVRAGFEAFMQRVDSLPAEHRPSEEAVMDVLQVARGDDALVGELTRIYSDRIWGDRFFEDDAEATRMQHGGGQPKRALDEAARTVRDGSRGRP